MKLPLTLLLCTLIAACSSLPLTFDPHALSDFKQAIKQQDFKRAQLIATQLPTYNDDYAAIQQALPALKQAKQQFVASALAQARTLATKQHWQAAIDLLTQANAKLAQADAGLSTLREQLLVVQQQQVTEQLTQLLGGEAEWLLKQRDTLTFLARQQLDMSAHKKARHLEQRRYQLGAQLVEQGLNYAHQSNWQASFYCLQLAQRLGADDFPQATFDKARAQLQHQQQHNQDQRNQQQQQEADRRIGVYRKSLRINDLLDARNYLNNHRDNTTLATQRKLVTRLSQQRYKDDMKLGDSFYANGNYRLAEHVWKRLAPLYPDNNELSKKLARVEKVLSSLNRLKDH